LIDLYEETWTPGGTYYLKRQCVLSATRDDSDKWIIVSRWNRGRGYPSLGGTKYYACKTNKEGRVVHEILMGEWDCHCSLYILGTGKNWTKILQLPAVQ
jgi:hypothetical protein